jgi:hypothetical protein
METLKLKKDLTAVYTELYQEQEKRKGSKDYKAVNYNEKFTIEFINDYKGIKKGAIKKVSRVMLKYFVDNGLAKELR